MKKRDIFTEVYNTYYPLVFSTIYTKVDNIDDAKDICQEVFIDFYAKFHEIENHRKWLYGALRFAVSNFYRRKKPDVNIDEVFNDIGLTFVNGMRDIRVIISETIENEDIFSDEKDKVLFDLIAVHLYSYSETGRELGLTKRQVEYKYTQLVNKIKDYLKKRGISNLEDLL